MSTQEMLALFKAMSTTRLADALQIDASAFSDVRLDSMGFSARSSHCLSRNKCTFLSDVLSSSFQNLSSWRNFGIQSAEEVFEKCNDFCSKEYFSHESNTDLPLESNISLIFQNVVRLLKEDLVSFENNDKKVNFIIGLGSLVSKDNPHYLEMEKMIDSLEVQARNAEEIEAKIIIPDLIRNWKALPFLQAYNSVFNSDLGTDLDSEKTVGELVNAIEAKNLKESSWKHFFSWANFDITEIFKAIYRDSLDDRQQYVLRELAAGRTLESVGKDYNITRERTRQIQIKASWRVHGNAAINQLCYKIFAISDGSPVIYIQDLQKVIPEEYWLLFEDSLKRHIFDETKKWHYSDEFEAVIFDFLGEIQLCDVDTIVAGFPDEIENGVMDEYLIAASEQHHCRIDLLVNSVSRQYMSYGEFYSRKKYTFIDMCAYVLRTRFPEGYHISDEEDYCRFAQAIKDVFNYMNRDISANYIQSRIGEYGYLCAPGTYKHIGALRVPEGFCDFISGFLEKEFYENRRTVLSYNEVYEKLKENFEETEINNQYVLHSAITQLGLPYKSSRSYISVSDDASFDEDFISYIREHYPVSVSNVSQHFFMTKQQVEQIAGRCSNVAIRGGMLLYMRK